MDREARIIDIADTLARVRRSSTPKMTSGTARRVVCVECGKKFTRSAHDNKTRCPTCARQRQIDAGLAGVLKQGPTYERVVRGQLRFWLAEAERLGIEVPDPAA